MTRLSLLGLLLLPAIALGSDSWFLARSRRLTSGASCSGAPCPDASGSCDGTQCCRSEHGYCGSSSGHCNDKSTWTSSCVDALECSGTPCESDSECRSQHGYCGASANHCNDKSTWTSSCENPLSCTGQPCESASECRSQHGYCGTTDGHCNTKSTWTQACSSAIATTTTTTAASGGAWDQGVMSMWEANADITLSKCGFVSSQMGGMNSPAKSKYIEEMAFCANDVLLWQPSQCGRCYEVRPILPNTAAVDSNVQPISPAVTKVVQIIDKNEYQGRNFDCNYHVFKDMTGHETDLFSLEWRPVDCDVEADKPELKIFNVIMNYDKVSTINVMFFNQKTSVVDVKMTAFKRCGDPPGEITCYTEEEFQFKRQGGGAIWENPGLSDGIVKPITFEMTLLNGDRKVFKEEDFITNQGEDPFSQVWSPPVISSTTTTAPVTCSGAPCPDANGSCDGTQCCRSKHGYCGSTNDHCNAESTWTTSCPAA